MASQYIAIVDAGSSSTRIFIYQWDSDVGNGHETPLTITRAFPPPHEDDIQTVKQGILLSLVVDLHSAIDGYARH